MAWFRPTVVLALLLTLAALTACGGNSSTLDNAGLGPAPQNSGVLPSIWDLDSEPGRGTSLIGGGGGQLTRLGKDYLENLVHNGTVDGDSVVLDSGAGGEHPVAWAVYRFEGLQNRRPTDLNVFATVGGLEQRYFIGLANYSEGTWEWFGPSVLPEFQIDLRESYNRYVTALGNMYFLVICEGGDVVTHDKSVLSYLEGDHDVKPGTPRELHATDGAHADKIEVSWIPGEGADSYELYRRMDGGEDWTVIVVTDHGYVDTDVEPGKHYIYKARSVNEAGFSSFSNNDSGFAGEMQGSECPSELSASDGTYAEKVKLQWQGSPAGTYKVYRRADGANEFEFLSMAEGNYFYDTTAEPGVTYIYKVGALHEGEMCYSNTDSGFRAESNDACPHEVWASDGTYEDKVRLEWMGVAGSFYKVFRKDPNTQEYVHIGGTDSGLDYNDTTAEPGVHYVYKVVLVENEQFVCHGSDEGYRAGDTQQDDCPTELGASDGTHTAKVVLEWNGNAERGYDVYRRADGENEFTFLAFVTGTHYYDTSAEPGVTYFYKVGLENPSGGCFSNIDSGWRAEEGEDHCPVELGASDGTHENGVQLEWFGTAGEGYKVYRRLDGSQEWVYLTTVEAQAYFDESAEAGNVYIYKVKHAVSGCASNEDAGHVGGGDQ